MYCHVFMNHSVCAVYAERLDKKFGAHYEFGDRREWVTSARTYFYEDEHACDNNVTHFIDGINTVSGHHSALASYALQVRTGQHLATQPNPTHQMSTTARPNPRPYVSLVVLCQSDIM